MPNKSNLTDQVCAVRRNLFSWARANWRHPAMVLPALILFTQIIGEFYPFSHFPMYSNPSDQPSDYIFVVDAANRTEDGEYIPVSMEDVFGVRAAKAKKIFISRLKDYAKDRGVEREDLTPEQTAEVAATLLEYLRGRAKAIRKTEQLPARLALVRGVIRAEFGVALHIEDELIVEEP